MVLILVIGDLHIPTRAHQIPHQFKTLLVPGKIHYVLCTGNLCTKETYDFFKSIAPEVHVVKGEYDENTTYPEKKVVTIEGFKIGLCHGHQIIPWGDRNSLGNLQRQMNCDMLITGHTHAFESFEMNNKYFINPGSATGAFSPSNPNPTPSFLLLDVQGDNISCFLYRLINGEVKVDKSTYSRKKDA